MNGVHTFRFRQRNHSRDVQIRLDWPLPFAGLIRFIRLEAMEGQPVFFRIHRHGPQAQFIRSTKDSNRDFAAIRRH